LTSIGHDTRVINDLIFDVGMHEGEDTAYYLTSGFRVIAIDADPNMIRLARENFSSYLDDGRLTILNSALSDKENEEATFYISEQTEWSSLKRSISDRKSSLREVIKVKTRTLPSLMREFGTPYYCKIDVEGYDRICLQTLSMLKPLPPFMSVETECLGEHETISEEQALETLVELHNLGYRKFKLVCQEDLTVLEPESRSFFKRIAPTSLASKFARARTRWLSSSLGYDFRYGSTGPFGNDLGSEWLSYESSRRTLLYHRRRYFKSRSAVNYGFWCDWHAKL